MKQYFSLGALGALLGLASALLPGCITVRQSGAHNFEINTTGNQNQFNAHTERQNSAQEAKSDPKLDLKNDLKVPIIPGT